MARSRTTEDVRRDIAREREQLVRAVAELRSEATSVKAKLPKIAGAAVASIAALKLVRRRFRRTD
ncbi:MAG TPA: hypothetical protein VGL76_03340 [Gaiellaceae bacterium]|jgi:hypothetical protein